MMSMSVVKVLVCCAEKNFEIKNGSMINSIILYIEVKDTKEVAGISIGILIIPCQ